MSFITTPNELPAPGTTGNVLTSNGTIWQSAAASSLPAVGASGNVLTSNGTVWASAAPTPPVNLGTPVTCSGQTSITFTGIPSTAKVIYINFNNFYAQYNSSGNGLAIKLGTASGLESSGYVSFSVWSYPISSGQYGYVCRTVSSAFGANPDSYIYILTDNYARNLYGTYILSLENSTNNSWSGQGQICTSGGNIYQFASGKSLASKLTQIDISAVGSNIGYSGEVNIAYS
jgi:hypothetical protein